MARVTPSSKFGNKVLDQRMMVMTQDFNPLTKKTPTAEAKKLTSSTQVNTMPDDFMFIKHNSGSVVSGSEHNPNGSSLGLFSGGPHIKQDSLMFTVEEGKVDF